MINTRFEQDMSLIERSSETLNRTLISTLISSNKKSKSVEGPAYCSDKVLKDNNFLEINKYLQQSEKRNGIIDISIQDYKHLTDTLKEDSKFLRNKGIMDYSLLVVVESCNKYI